MIMRFYGPLACAALIGLAACAGETAPANTAEAGQASFPPITRADLPGRQVFERQCAPCHGDGPGGDGTPMLPATAALLAKYEGAVPALLELRDDLNGDVLRLFVRNGVGGMPPFRKSELSDTQIDEIAAYLAATAELSQ